MVMTCEEMDREYGYEIYQNAFGKTYIRGAGTDWCYYPVEDYLKDKPDHPARCGIGHKNKEET